MNDYDTDFHKAITSGNYGAADGTLPKSCGFISCIYPAKSP